MFYISGLQLSDTLIYITQVDIGSCIPLVILTSNITDRLIIGGTLLKYDKMSHSTLLHIYLNYYQCQSTIEYFSVGIHYCFPISSGIVWGDGLTGIWYFSRYAVPVGAQFL